VTSAKKIITPVTLAREIAIDWGLVDPAAPSEPEPTPAEKALAILAPHLATEPLYRP
jgi:hypothetical protein